jgi:hypothetical protein
MHELSNTNAHNNEVPLVHLNVREGAHMYIVLVPADMWLQNLVFYIRASHISAPDGGQVFQTYHDDACNGLMQSCMRYIAFSPSSLSLSRSSLGGKKLMR